MYLAETENRIDFLAGLGLGGMKLEPQMEKGKGNGFGRGNVKREN